MAISEKNFLGRGQKLSVNAETLRKTIQNIQQVLLNHIYLIEIYIHKEIYIIILWIIEKVDMTLKEKVLI